MTDIIETLARGPATSRVVEIGGGTGFLARELHAMGLEVRSFDPSPREPLSYPVHRAFGHHLPVPDDWADLVFSCQVLEHIPEPELTQTLEESQRVLRPGGKAIFMVPTAASMLVTFLLQPAENLRRWLYLPTRLLGPAEGRNPCNNPLLGGSESGSAKLLRALTVRWILPRRHGAAPTALHELFAWRRPCWMRKWRRGGFRVLAVRNSGLAGSLHQLTGTSTWPLRKALGRVGFAATHIFVLEA